MMCSDPARIRKRVSQKESFWRCEAVPSGARVDGQPERTSGQRGHHRSYHRSRTKGGHCDAAAHSAKTASDTRSRQRIRRCQFVDDARQLGITPHVASSNAALRASTAAHAASWLSTKSAAQSTDRTDLQLVENIGMLRKTRHRGHRNWSGS